MQAKASFNTLAGEKKVTVYLENTRREWSHLLVTFVLAPETV